MRIFLASLGVLSLVLGIIGAFLPILPTTPFVLLAAYLFGRSSPKLNAWLLNHKIFGKIIYDFQVEKSITLHAKIISISMLWMSMLISVIFVLEGRIWLQLMLLIIATGVTIHILRYKTKR
ncbi:MAG: YbaN family protein [Paludibacter sp.]